MMRPKRYLDDLFDEQRRRCGLTWDQVMARTVARFEQAASEGLTERSICRYRLDNPFMQDHARDTLAAQARKDLTRRREYWRGLGRAT